MTFCKEEDGIYKIITKLEIMAYHSFRKKKSLAM